MSVSHIPSGFNPYSSGPSSLFQHRRLDFKAMESAVQSGDMTAAQNALSAWKSDTQNIQSAQSSSLSQGSQPNSPFQTDLNALVKADDSNSSGTSLNSIQLAAQAAYGAQMNTQAPIPNLNTQA